MLEELLFKYRALAMGKRMALVILLGLLPGACNYFEASPDLQAEVETARQREAMERQRLATAKAQAKNLPATEEKLAFTTDQLKKAETLLPNAVQVDQVLEQMGKAALESDVNIKYFAPSGEKTIPGEYPYDEVRFKLVMAGQYPRLGKWLDTVAGGESKGYVKSWEFSRGTKDRASSAKPAWAGVDGSSNQETPLSPRERAVKAREDYTLELKAEVAFYRVASSAPDAKPDGSNATEKRKGPFTSLPDALKEMGIPANYQGDPSSAPPPIPGGPPPTAVGPPTPLGGAG